MMRPGMSRLIIRSENSHAAMIAKAGLTNSDGWIDWPKALIQRRAPFTSAPYLSVAQSARMLTTSVTSAASRTCRAVSSDAPIITAIEGMAKPHCRTMKK